MDVKPWGSFPVPLGLCSLPCNKKGDEDYKVNETERAVSIPNKDPINVVSAVLPYWKPQPVLYVINKHFQWVSFQDQEPIAEFKFLTRELTIILEADEIT